MTLLQGNYRGRVAGAAVSIFSLACGGISGGREDLEGMRAPSDDSGSEGVDDPSGDSDLEGPNDPVDEEPTESTDDLWTDEDQFSPYACPSGSRFEEMNLAVMVDYVAWRRVDESGEVPFVELDSFGTACRDGDSECMAEFESALPDNDAWSYCDILGCSYWGLVTMVGGKATVHETTAEIVQVLGEIDTVAEAALVAHSAPHYLDCGASSYLSTDSGTEFLTESMTSPCPITFERLRIRVLFDGTVEVMGRDHLQVQEDACI